MLKISFNGTNKKLADAISSKQPRLMEALREEMELLMLVLQRRIQQKLSGEVLNQRTGKLIGSVHTLGATRANGVIKGLVQAGGGPAYYGKFHEFGTRNSYRILPRNKKALAFFPSNSLGGGGGIVPLGKAVTKYLYTLSGKARGSLKPSSYGKFAGFGGVVVKGVTHPPIQQRSFMASSLKELTETIISRLHARGAQVLREPL